MLLFWLSHKSISHEYINILFDWQKMQRDGRPVKVDQLADYSLTFLGGFLNTLGNFPSDSALNQLGLMGKKYVKTGVF